MGHRSSPRQVVIVVYPGVQSLDVTGPLEVFSGASRLLAGRGDRSRGAATRFGSSAATGRSLSTSSGMTLTPHCALGQAPSGDRHADRGGRGRLRGGRRRQRADRVDRRGGPRRQAHRIGVHGRLSARSRRPARRSPGDHPLGGGRAARAPASPACMSTPSRSSCATGGSGPRPGVTAGMDLALALVEEDSRPRGGADDRPPPGALSAPSRQPVAVQRHARRPAARARAAARGPAVGARGRRAGSIRSRRWPPAPT